ncbi:MAG: beta-galactosidase [Planctomycetota bacterium]|nr:beta-galactosidase [Planctomycetota bacterium]
MNQAFNSVVRAVFITGLAAISTAAFAADLGRPFPSPDRIRYDSQCMTIEGKDILIFSGAFHYFRCPKELWADRFAKIKAAGFNTVETYIAWNMQEAKQPAGLDDYSQIDLRDVEDWLRLAEQNGLYVIIRPGPYICAEFWRGGIPGWMENLRPDAPRRTQWLRSDDPTFVAWSKHWLHAVCPMLAPHQITHKKPGEPGIILFQLENEYDYSNLPDEVKISYMKSLGEEALTDGIDVPMISCWTRSVRGNQDPILRHVFDSCNFYPAWKVDGTLKDIQSLRKSQPDAPLMTTELQGGWFTGTSPTDGPQLLPDSYRWRPDLVPAQINNLTLFAWQNGETITSYYMLFGGTNLADTAARGISTSYDYSAPIRENGGIDEKYLRVAALGNIIRDHGAALARAKAVDCKTTTGQADVTVVERRAPDGSRFIFVRSNQHDSPRAGAARLTEQGDGGIDLTFNYDLEPFGAKILYLPPGTTDAARGQWLPTALPSIARPANLPASVKITQVRTLADPGPEQWKPMKLGQSLASLGIYDSRNVFYRVGEFPVTAGDLADPGHVGLTAFHDGSDRLIALVNGQRATLMGEGSAAEIPAATKALHVGENSLVLLYENAGFPNGSEDMIRFAGISHLRLSPIGVGAISGWRMHLVAKMNRPDRQPAIAVDFADQDWPNVAVDKVEADQLKPGETAVFRATIQLSQNDVDAGKTEIIVSRMDDKGSVYVNGKRVGQGDSATRSYDFDAAKLLHAGNNVIAVVVQNDHGLGGLGIVELVSSAKADTASAPKWEYSDQPAGVAGQWWKPALDDSSWKSNPLPEPPSDMTSLLTWRRLSFALPAQKPNVWVPWLIRLNAQGNGSIYLNGHPIGRYWQYGGQHDYFLPECWLNFGNDGKNVVTLALSPVEKATSVHDAEVIPYTAYAESR